MARSYFNRTTEITRKGWIVIGLSVLLVVAAIIGITLGIVYGTKDKSKTTTTSSPVTTTATSAPGLDAKAIEHLTEINSTLETISVELREKLNATWINFMDSDDFENRTDFAMFYDNMTEEMQVLSDLANDIIDRHGVVNDSDVANLELLAERFLTMSALLDTIALVDEGDEALAADLDQRIKGCQDLIENTIEAINHAHVTTEPPTETTTASIFDESIAVIKEVNETLDLIAAEIQSKVEVTTTVEPGTTTTSVPTMTTSQSTTSSQTTASSETTSGSTETTTSTTIISTTTTEAPTTTKHDNDSRSVLGAFNFQDFYDRSKIVLQDLMLQTELIGNCSGYVDQDILASLMEDKNNTEELLMEAISMPSITTESDIDLAHDLIEEIYDTEGALDKAVEDIEQRPPATTQAPPTQVDEGKYGYLLKLVRLVQAFSGRSLLIN
jgi:hypothetical protein